MGASSCLRVTLVLLAFSRDDVERAVDSEEAEIEEIAEADEPGDEASSQGDPHISSSSGSRYDLDPSMLNH